MKKSSKKIPYFKQKYFWVGLFFLLIQGVVITRNSFLEYTSYFWFCDTLPLVLAFAFFFKREQVIKALINFGLLFQVFFILLLVNNLIRGVFLEELIFSPFNNFLYLSATILFHLSTTFALFLTYKIKPNLRTINYSIAVIIVTYVSSLIFTPYDLNINRIILQWTFIPFTIPYYIVLWPFLAFIFLVLPTQGIQYLLYKWSIRNKAKPHH